MSYCSKMESDPSYFRSVSKRDLNLLLVVLLHAGEDLVAMEEFIYFIYNENLLSKGSIYEIIGRYYCNRFNSSPINTAYCSSSKDLFLVFKNDFPKLSKIL